MGAIVFLAVIVLTIAGMWKVYTKANEPGWACIVPIYNIIVMLRIAGKPWWWLFLFFIPLVGAIFAIIATHQISKNFGQGVGTTLLLIFLPMIGYPVLGFGSSVYSESA